MSRITLGHRLFKTGRIPAPLREELERENLRFALEGIPVTITVRAFRAPGKYASLRKRRASGAVAVTNDRLVVLGYRQTLINLPFADPRFDELEIETVDEGLRFALDAGDFNEDASGQVEFTLLTQRAAEIEQWIRAGR